MATKRRTADLAEHTAERVVAREVARTLVWLPPWLGWVLILVLAVVLHAAWPGWWGGAAVMAAGVVLGLWDLYLTRQRKGLGRYVAGVTSAAAGLWLGWVMVAGLGGRHTWAHTAQFRVWLVFGGLAAAIWSHWLHIHEAGDETGLSRAFGKWSARAGHDLKLIKVVKAAGGKITGQLVHGPGVTHDDALKAVGAVESAAQLAPGTMVVTPHMDNAGRSHVVFADPRALREPIVWPGPSAEGKSWAKPRRVGKWQDGSPLLMSGHSHLQIMAMSNVGKTTGGMYSIMGERISRFDVNTIIIDLAKGEQFAGPLRPAVNYVATTPEQARWVLEQTIRASTARTNYLATKHLGEWREGCGLNHFMVWIEEASRAFEALDDGTLEELLFPLLREVRSGGGEVDYSLHRASYDQMPTFVKDMVGMCCMGVRNSSHAKFGLSDAQQEADCAPEKWADRPEYRGYLYMDTAGIPAEYRTMPGRWFYWGDDTTMMAEYAARFPAKPWDDVTAPFFARPPLDEPEQPEEAPQGRPAVTLTEPPKEAPVRTPGVDEEPWLPGDDEPLTDQEVEAGGDLPIGAPQPPPGPAVPVSPEVAVQRVRQQIHQWRVTGVPQRTGPPLRTFATKDLRPLVEGELGRVRSWAYQVMPRLVAEGEVRKIDGGWEILDKAA